MFNAQELDELFNGLSPASFQIHEISKTGFEPSTSGIGSTAESIAPRTLPSYTYR